MGLLDVFSSIRERADRFLNEKNVVTDFLGKIEEKTGVKKKILAAGTSLRFVSDGVKLRLGGLSVRSCWAEVLCCLSAGG